MQKLFANFLRSKYIGRNYDGFYFRQYLEKLKHSLGSFYYLGYFINFAQNNINYGNYGSKPSNRII